MMKVLQINCVYKKGSTGKITCDIHNELLGQGFESVVCYGRGERNTEPHVYKTCGELYSKVNHFFANITGVIYGGCFFSTRKLIGIIKKERPDIVHLQCINGYFVNIYKLLAWLKQNQMKTVLTLHAEFMYTGGCGHAVECTQWRDSAGCGHDAKCPRYRLEFHSCFDRSDTMWKQMNMALNGFGDNLMVASVSPWLMERAENSTIMKELHHCVVLNGVNADIFHLYDTSQLREQLGLTGKKIIFHATPAFSSAPNHIKGGFYVLELAKRLKEVTFIVAGPCQGEVLLPENVILLGNVGNQNLLARYYSMADVTLLTSKRETFSMICAESLSCGTPIVGFRAGAPEMISLPEFSRFVAYGDMDVLTAAAEQMIEAHHNKKMIARQGECYSNKIMTENYLAVYRKLLDGQGNET